MIFQCVELVEAIPSLLQPVRDLGPEGATNGAIVIVDVCFGAEVCQTGGRGRCC
jgi:hypothetical protein